MIRTDRQRAEACFAVARSTTHAGEREAAIGRGLAICERKGLDPDTFDIPGRQRASARSPRGNPATGKRPQSFIYDEWWEGDAMRRDTASVERAARTRASVEAITRAFEEAIAAAAARAGAQADESPYEASRRNFDEACAAAKARDARRELAAQARAAADQLWTAGEAVYAADGGWVRFDTDGAHACDDAGLVAYAAQRDATRATPDVQAGR